MKRQKKTTNISISLDLGLIDYIDEVAAINGRTRSAMISWMIQEWKKEYDSIEDDFIRLCDSGELSKREVAND